MFVYNLHWKAEKTLLLYPKVSQIDSHFGTFHFNNLGKKCKLGFVDIMHGLTMKNNKTVAKEIFEKLDLEGRHITAVPPVKEQNLP